MFGHRIGRLHRPSDQTKPSSKGTGTHGVSLETDGVDNYGLVDLRIREDSFLTKEVHIYNITPGSQEAEQLWTILP